MNRLLALAFALLAAAPAGAADMPRIGVLSFTQVTPAMQQALRQGLREHGYEEKRNILVEWRTAGGQIERARAAAKELVGLKVNVIVAMLTPAVQASKDATGTIPIVMAPAGDPLATGFAKTLARPGGNITGIAGQGAAISGKRISLMRELVPGLKAFGVLTNSLDPFAKPFVSEHRLVAERAGLRLHIADARRPEDVDAALASLAREGVGAVVVQGVLTGQGWQVGPLAAKHRLPSVSNLKQFVDSGGMLSYGANFDGIYRRAASYVDRLLKGAKAAEIPIELPTEFELIVNLRAARAVGRVVPPAILVRADQVIE
jgi:putative tryptophan/tyrosine transport system substrate-binding protein